MIIMISYQVMNIHLSRIGLPKTIEEALDYKFEFTDVERDFIIGANAFLRRYAEFENYRLKDVYCLGTCLFNFTRIGIYYLLEDEIVTVSTSNLKKINGTEPDWRINHFPFKIIESLDLEMAENINSQKYESGILYVKVRNHKGVSRTHVLHNVNPEHIECFRDFYTNIMKNIRIRGA